MMPDDLAPGRLVAWGAVDIALAEIRARHGSRHLVGAWIRTFSMFLVETFYASILPAWGWVTGVE